jgi:hypothetical protein
MLPLTTGPSLLLELDTEDARDVLERLLVAALVVLVDLRDEAVVPPFLVVVAICQY